MKLGELIDTIKDKIAEGLFLDDSKESNNNYVGKEVIDLSAENTNQPPFVTTEVAGDSTQPSEATVMEEFLTKVEGYVNQMREYKTQIDEAATRTEQAERRMQDSALSKLSSLQASMESIVNETKEASVKADTTADNAEAMVETQPQVNTL